MRNHNMFHATSCCIYANLLFLAISNVRGLPQATFSLGDWIEIGERSSQYELVDQDHELEHFVAIGRPHRLSRSLSEADDTDSVSLEYAQDAGQPSAQAQGAPSRLYISSPTCTARCTATYQQIEQFLNVKL